MLLTIILYHYSKPASFRLQYQKEILGKIALGNVNEPGTFIRIP